MKRIFLIALTALFFQTQVNAQEETFANNQNKHEFRLDALEILTIPKLEINYEYVNNKYSGYGAALSLTFQEGYDFQEKFSFTPYYRQYFLNKKDYGARGLFVEGMLRVASGVNEQFDFDDNTGIETTLEENWFDMGLGLALGQKWVSENGFVFELSFGGGRYLLDSKADDFFLRGGVLIGYRFF